MLTYLAAAVMAFLPPPEIRGKQNQYRKNFQPPNQHGDCAHPSLEIG
jgi:hypothetical protein